MNQAQRRQVTWPWLHRSKQECDHRPLGLSHSSLTVCVLGPVILASEIQLSNGQEFCGLADVM